MDILEAIDSIKSYTQGMDYSSFEKDKKTRDAVVRNLEVIGEAAKNIPEETRRKHSDINWRVVAGMRDRLIHEYFGVSVQITWETVKNDLPTLERIVRKIMDSYSAE
nr:DUF86 domain-containing protein [Candidatus Njordarchaeota archaeon]